MGTYFVTVGVVTTYLKICFPPPPRKKKRNTREQKKSLRTNPPPPSTTTPSPLFPPQKKNRSSDGTAVSRSVVQLDGQEKAELHLGGGAKKVIISAPPKAWAALLESARMGGLGVKMCVSVSVCEFSPPFFLGGGL